LGHSIWIVLLAASHATPLGKVRESNHGCICPWLAWKTPEVDYVDFEILEISAIGVTGSHDATAMIIMIHWPS
jgi:hypothetical protein